MTEDGRYLMTIREPDSLDRECRLGYEDGAEDRDGLVELSADARDDNEDLAGVVDGKSMGGEAS